ncbi:MAG TPA: hypothetical protein DEB31_09465 [Clostridiales bacterium]|nr:hypothetical protein [Clostridiales bacterium]
MSSKRRNTVADIFNVVIIAGMLLLLALFVALPFLTDLVSDRFWALAPSMIFFYAGGVLALWFLYLLRKLILSVRAGNPFTKQNVEYLKKLSFSLLFLMGDFIFISCFIPSVSKMLCIGLLLLGFLSARVLAYLVGRAAEYREEVDLTV